MTSSAEQKLSLRALIALVVGSMIGSGIFALPSAFGRATGVMGALIAWVVAGVGMLMLAFVFQTLARRKPDLDAGIYAYAKAGFGEYPGFVSAVGYWIGACLADVACLVLIKATLGLFFPIFGDGTTPTAILAASVLLWAVHFMILRGVKEAAAINTIATVAKIVPIALFIVVAIAAFRADLFALNFWGGEEPTFGNVANQARNSMLVTVFLFVGIEGASVYSRYAKNRNDVGIATVLGFLGVLCLLILVTMLSYGVMLRPDLAALSSPSMAGVMEAIVGPWGKIFISIGLLISVLGNYLSWSLLAAEVVYSAAQNRTMPSFLARENKNKAPVAALVAHQRGHPALPDRHLVRRVRLHHGAQDDEFHDLDPVSAGRRLRAEARLDRRDIHRRRPWPQGRLDARRDRDDLRRRHALCRWCKVHPAVGAALRAGHHPVHHCETRTGYEGLHPRRVAHLRGRHRRGHHAVSTASRRARSRSSPHGVPPPMSTNSIPDRRMSGHHN